MARIARALISVSDKSGLVPLAQALAEAGVEMISTGGTAKVLQEAGLPVIELSAHTGFPEMLDGRKIGIDGHGPGSLRKISEKFLKASKRLVPGFRIPGSKYLERDGVPDKLPPGCNIGKITGGDHLGNEVSAGSCLDGTGMNSYAAGGCN